MTTKNFTQTTNNCFYGQSNYMSAFSGAQVQPTIAFPSEPTSFSFDDLHIPIFDNGVFSEDTETSSVSSGLQKASKKISKPQEGAKKIMRKKHNRARNPWTPQEDAKLVELMKKHGQSWAMISAAMEGRTGKQIRDRFLNKLRPNIKCGDWSAEEDEKMVRLLNEIGNRWSLIATHLPGRTEGQVKNRYYSCIKKRLQANGALSQTSATRTASETATSFAASPEAEETKFDFGYEFDVNTMNGSNTFVNHESAVQVPTQNTTFMVSKGPYNFQEDIFAQDNSHTDNTFQFADSFSYESFGQTQACDSFFLPPIEHDSQVDDMLDKVTSFYMEKSAVSDVDSYFSDELRNDKNSFEAEKLSQLSKRKAYLELALAKTLKEIKGL
jgi:hypothetical protein